MKLLILFLFLTVYLVSLSAFKLPYNKLPVLSKARSDVSLYNTNPGFREGAHLHNALLHFKQEFLKVLPFLAFALSLGGVSFQVFVLYPWHEELSAEFKDLEVAIIRLDTTLKRLDPEVDTIKLQRETDKYVTGVEAYKAGPRISKLMPSQLWESIK